jgi:hypothetical protein
MDIEIEDDDDFLGPRRSLLTTREKELAQSRAELLQMFAQMEKAKTETVLARQEARELREHIIATSTQPRKVNFRIMAMALMAVLMLAAILEIAHFAYEHPPAPELASAPLATGSPIPRKTRSHAASDVRFNMAIHRLQDLFESLPEDEAEVVKQINEKNPDGPHPCPLEWNKGAVALSLGGKSGDLPPSLLAAVNQCAAAVEKFRAEDESSTK